MNVRRFPFRYYQTFTYFILAVFIPIIIDRFFIRVCMPSGRNTGPDAINITHCPDPVWYQIYFLTILAVIFVFVVTGHFVKPKGPMLTISGTELRYNRIPFFLSLPFLWKTYPLHSIASMHLVVREKDKHKAGFKESGNQEDINKYYDDMPFSEIQKKVSLPNALDRSGATPVYKNQKLLLMHKDKSQSELDMSFAFEEDLQRLGASLKEKGIPFTIVFADMPDTVKAQHGQSVYDQDR